MTAITLSSLATTSVTKAPQGKLNQLWKEIEKKALRNQRYQIKLEGFYHDFKALVEPQEQAVCRATEKWIGHLIGFIARKTIKGSQREALYEWIDQELSILESNPFSPVELGALRGKFSEAMIAYTEGQSSDASYSKHDLELMRHELSKMLGISVVLTDEQLTEMVNNPRLFQAYIQEQLELQHEQQAFDEDDDEIDDIDWGEERFFEHDFTADDAPSPDIAPMADVLYSNKEMTRLYRQLAKKLHPDRETDPSKKAQMQVWMQQLSQAKKDKDPVSLILLAQQFLPEYEMMLDKEMIQQLQRTLEDKLAQLNAEYREMQHGEGLESQLWRRFGGGSKASREKGLNQYRSRLEEEVDELHQQCAQLKTVKQIKVKLAGRVEQAQLEQMLFELNPFELDPFELDPFNRR